jgi:rhodanese-related sulfurtransferase
MSYSYNNGFENAIPEDVRDLVGDKNVQFLDVREPWEFQITNIEGSVNIPLGVLPLRLSELDKRAKTVVLCHHGNRSYFACRVLEKGGFVDIINLAGGLDMWRQTVDFNMPAYSENDKRR